MLSLFLWQLRHIEYALSTSYFSPSYPATHIYGPILGSSLTSPPLSATHLFNTFVSTTFVELDDTTCVAAGSTGIMSVYCVTPCFFLIFECHTAATHILDVSLGPCYVHFSNINKLCNNKYKTYEGENLNSIRPQANGSMWNSL